MKKILFVIHDLGQGGAEKVLVNLVNNMDKTKFDITVLALFGGGVNEQFLSSDVHYKTVFKKEFRGNSRIMKLWSPKQLFKKYIKDKYDIIVSYLEGPSARVVSGCPDTETKKLCWIHCTMKSQKGLAGSFRSYKEAKESYEAFDRMVFVSEGVKKGFFEHCPIDEKAEILYNTNESDRIIKLSQESGVEGLKDDGCLRIIGVGKVVAGKGFDRLARVHKKLCDEGYKTHCYVLGVGEAQTEIQQYLDANGIGEIFTFLGYQTNPYKYVAKSDLFVCSSFSEGFSTAATEALIVGTPVCTVEVSGMKEMLGENNEYGVVVDNDEEALYQGIKRFLDEPKLLEHYKKQAEIRGKRFSTEETVREVEEMLLGL